MDEILQGVLVVAAQVLTPVVMGALAVLIKDLVAKIRASSDQDKWDFAVGLAQQAVMAAEQLGLTGAIAREAEAKRAFAIDFVEAALARRGIHLELDEIADIVEAQVMEVFNQHKL